MSTTCLQSAFHPNLFVIVELRDHIMLPGNLLFLPLVLGPQGLFNIVLSSDMYYLFIYMCNQV